MRYIGFLLLFAPLAALAQTTQPASPPSQPPASGNQDSATCDAWRTGPAQHAEGTTTISLDVKTDGAIGNVNVVQSSGNSDLDAAASNCMKAAHLKPATEHGQSIEVAREIDVHWTADGHSFQSPTRPPGAELTRRSCRERILSRDDLHHLIPTVVTFQIAVDGTSQDAQIAQSSGNRALDQASVDCVLSAFRYVPVMQNGKAVQIDARAEFSWKRR